MKSVTVAQRSVFPVKDYSKYLLISISFNRLLLAVCIIAPLEQNKSSGTAQSSRDKTFCRSTSLRSLLTDSNHENRFTSFFKVTVILIAKNRLVTTGKCCQIQLPEAVAWRCQL